MSKQVFISYSTDDTAIAEQIRDGLEAASTACWMAPRDIAPGLDYGTQIIDAIEGCTVLLLVLSESSNDSIYVRNEVERAIAKRRVVIPFRIHDVQPSRGLEFFISNAQWIDAWQGPLASHVDALSTAIRHHVQSPATPASHPVTFPVAPSPAHLPANRHSNLPTPSTPFVGRSHELAEITGKLADPTCRLLTLAGPGGVGKSRLALEIAHRILAESTLAPDGVFFVALDSLAGPEQIAPAIAMAIGLSLTSQSEPIDALLSYLAGKKLLLILDNFEHLLSGAQLVAEILAAAPAVNMLVTSREALSLQEEWFHPIAGLDLPAAGWVAVDEALASGAVQLFVQCARRSRPGFDPRLDTDCVVRLCRLVDGLPLALELAAAWLRSLPCAQIVRELQSSLDLLATSMRNVPQRHRSMLAVFEQSWQLLEQPARNVLCQLAVFEGGFDWAAAKAVSGVSMSMLTRLVDGSWIQMNAAGRYDLQPLVRSFLLLRLEDEFAHLAGEPPNRVRDRHSRYYAGLPADMAPTIREWEIANLRAGWRHALGRFSGADLNQYVTQMLDGSLAWKHWPGSYHEVAELLMATESRLRAEMTQDKAIPVKDATYSILARLLIQRAIESNKAGLSQKAEALCRECLANLDLLGAKDGPDWLRGWALINLSWILISQSRLQEADEAANQALAVYSDLDAWEFQTFGLHYLAYSAEEQGRYAAADGYLRRALQLLRADRVLGFNDYIVRSRLGSVSYMMGDYTQTAHWWGKAAEILHMVPRTQRLEHQVFWARLEIATGDLASARTRCLAVLPDAREHSIIHVQAFALTELGHIALIQGAADESSAYFADAAQVAAQSARRKEVARATIGLGRASLARLDLPAAAAHFCHALSVTWPLGILPEVISAIVGLAQVEVQQGNRSQAAAWLRMAVEHPATPHHIRQEAEAVLVALAEHAPVITTSLEEIVAVVLASPEVASVENTQ